MKMLLLGPNGQVSWELQRALAPLGRLIVLGRKGANDQCGDLAQPEALANTVRHFAPDVIVNAAAYTAVDRAESEPELARIINTEAVSALAAEASRLGAWLVHYSTDYVFDGSGEAPWQEDDPAGPLSTYGQTKYDGEIAIRESGCKHLIFRTSWVYAPRGKNFIRTMLRLATEREALKIIDDQHGAPTGAELIADVTAQAIPHALDQPERSGIYHLAAAGETTWHGYACFLIEQARAAGWPIRVPANAIEAVPTEAFPTQAARPRNSRLDFGKLERTFELTLPGWRDGVCRALTEIMNCESKQVTQ